MRRVFELASAFTGENTSSNNNNNISALNIDSFLESMELFAPRTAGMALQQPSHDSLSAATGQAVPVPAYPAKEEQVSLDLVGNTESTKDAESSLLGKRSL